MPEQDAMRMQRSLRLSGRAGGVDDQGGVICGGVGRREFVASAFQRRPEQWITATIAVYDQDRREIGQAWWDLGQIFAVGDQRLGAAIGEAVLDGIRAELHEQRYRHRAELIDREMRNGGLRPLRQ